MLVTDLLHSCANERVAEAAVWSIGGDVVQAMMAESDRRGIAVGAIAASMVRRFAREATEREWRDLVDGVRGHDVPVLEGLRLILTKPPRRSLGDSEATQSARVSPPSSVVLAGVCAG